VVGPEIEKTINNKEEEILADIKTNEEIVEDANATTGRVIRELARIAFADPPPVRQMEGRQAGK